MERGVSVMCKDGDRRNVMQSSDEHTREVHQICHLVAVYGFGKCCTEVRGEQNTKVGNGGVVGPRYLM